MQFHRLASVLAPPRCIACAGAADPRRPLCPRCSAALNQARPGRSLLGIAGAHPLAVEWACEYTGVARDLVRALKFGSRIAAASTMAARLALLVPTGATVVPVPPAPWRRRMRGFDPAEQIALAVARRTGVELVSCLRRANGPRQVGRSRADRLATPPHVYCAGVAPAGAVLVDDVFTTGATLSACARALGGSAVGAYVFARAI